MRQIFLDTETTGLEHKLGHRIIEIAGVEMQNRRLSGRHLHFYINPEREVDAGAQDVHGLSNEFLEDKPKFAQIAKEIRDFIKGTELIIHNAPFDIAFLDAEFARLNLSSTKEIVASVVDTLKMARDLHPGKRNNLDALCERYLINNAHRTLHSALLDAELLADVYIAMTRGQESLLAELPAATPQQMATENKDIPEKHHASPHAAPTRIIRADTEELAAHQQILASIDMESKGKCLWRPPSQ